MKTGIATRSSFPDSFQRHRARRPRPEKSSMPSSITTPPTNSPTSSNGLPIIRAGRSISPPTSASWLNPVEGFFSAISRRRIRRGAFTSVGDLQNAIDRYIDAHNNDCRPFVWTTSAKSHLRKTRSDPCTFYLSQCTRRALRSHPFGLKVSPGFQLEPLGLSDLSENLVHRPTGINAQVLVVEAPRATFSSSRAGHPH